jgi:hypothetical protein
MQQNSQYRKLGPTGPSGINPSTAASTNTQKTDFYSSRGFGELGSTKKKEELKEMQSAAKD